MEGKIRLAVFGQKRLSREGGIEIVVKELCTRILLKWSRFNGFVPRKIKFSSL